MKPGPAPAVPDVASLIFGRRLDLAVRYAELLCTAGVERGLLGPAEAPRVWARHILNCAVLTDVIEPDESIVDVGSGAGLPGIVVAIRRPDALVTLLEPLQRRAAFLTDVVDELGLTNVAVLRSRAEELRVPPPGYAVATARAVAPLERLLTWCLPLLSPEGRVVAIKGRNASREVDAARVALDRAGATSDVVLVGEQCLEEPTTLVIVRRRQTSPTGTRSSAKGPDAWARRPFRGGSGR